MAVIPLVPLLLKDCIVDIAGSDYGEAVSSVAFEPSVTAVTFKGLKPNAVFTDTSSPQWTCNITFAQDWDSATSLSRYLFDHVGETVEMAFHPRTGSGPSFTASIVVTPGSIGGAVEAHATSTVALGVSGAPVLVPAA